MDKSTEAVKIDNNRRDFIKKAAYSAPAIVTMAAVPSFASAGSGWQQLEPGNEFTTSSLSSPRTTEREHRRSR